MSAIGSSFRRDIASLRGLAVLLVVANHFSFPGFQFGFIGVDIFFVISGYLITRVLYRDYMTSMETTGKKSGTISLTGFYLRRFRRLFPAAFAVIIVSNILSLFIFNQNEQTLLRTDSRWAILFFANIAFLRSGADYFNQGTLPSLLQHYWSLSIEEQFYFVWPLLFILASYYQGMTFRTTKIRFSTRLFFVIGFTVGTSFLFLQYRFTTNPLDAYFSIFTRAWELGIGGLFGVLAYQPWKFKRFSSFERISLFVIPLMATFFLIDERNWARWVFIPVLATGIFLFNGANKLQEANEPKSLFKFVASILEYFGKISYSLYLVHWPVYIFGLHFGWTKSPIVSFLLCLLSIFLSIVLWKYIETPFMRIRIKQSKEIDSKFFEILRGKKFVLFPTIFTLVLSLYVVTYPQNAPKFYLNSELLQSAELETLQKYADIENLLAQGAGTDNFFSDAQSVPSESSTLLTGTGDYAELSDIQKSAVSSAVSKTKLETSEQSQLKNIATDMSPFERAICPNVDTIIPVSCDAGNRSSGAKKVALLGDSKMAHFAEPLISYFGDKNWHVVPWVMTGCNLTFPVNSNLRTHCKERSDWIAKNIATQKFDLVILAQYPGMTDIEGQKKYFKILEENAGKVIVLMQSPTTSNPINCIKGDFTYSVDCSKIPQDFMGVWSSYTSNFPKTFQSEKTIVVESHKWWCYDAVCPLSIGGQLASRDGSHLTYTYVKTLQPLISSMLDELTQ
jgi:peptidoglycan/LPS O-acetylase OafA/YrhL